MLPTSWQHFLNLFAPCFTAPGQRLFVQIVTAWVQCPGRRTLTRLWSVIPSPVRRAYNTYARWLRVGKWSMDELWRLLLCCLVDHWAPEGVIDLHLDDTLIHKTGRKVEGAGFFRDAVRSTANHLVTAWGLNVIILAIRINPPWGGEPLALPVLARVHRKDELSLIELASTMAWEVAQWLPHRQFRLALDGAYASIVAYDLPTTEINTRIRCNAAINDLAPPPTGRRGRPRTKGDKLPSPAELATQVTDWTTTQICVRGQMIEVQLYSRLILWYAVARSKPLLLVIVRDPAGRQRDDFFISTNPQADPARVAAAYGDRWAIEDTNRNLKQFLGAQDPQSWMHLGPERVVSLACWLYSAVWHWYAALYDGRPSWPDRPWYTTKRTPSFADALAALRRELWTSAISSLTGSPNLSPEITHTLLNVLAEAA